MIIWAMVALLTATIHVNAQSVSYAKSLIEQGRYLDAAKQLRPMADGGNAEAQYLAAICFFHGDGPQFKKNAAQGIKYATMSANQGNEDAILLLARHYLLDIEDYDKEFTTLQHYSAKHPYMLKGDVGWMLAACYLNGHGTAANPEKAWEIALELDHAEDFKKAFSTEWEAYKDKHPELFKVYDVVEQMPSFPGGQAALFRWFEENLNNYYNVNGRLIITFVVKRDGSLADWKVAGNSSNLAEHVVNGALGDLKKMPNWIPGRQNGKPVNVKYTIPATFRQAR